jgi:hypothetical protein
VPIADRPFVDAPVGDAAAAQALAVRVARELGLPAPTLLRVGMNASFRSGDLVLRFGRPSAPPEGAIELTARLRAHGLAVPRSAGAPWHGPDGLVATIWEWIEPIDRPVDWSEVGRQIRRLHDLDPARVVPDGHPCPRPDRFAWWDFDAMLAEVSDLLDPEARRGIERVCERHAAWRSTLGEHAVLCHGDVHPGNVLATADGVVLLDWDLLCRAPRAWDVAALATLHERWGGDPTVMREFTRGYSTDLMLDPRATAYAELRLVAATLLRLRAGRHDPVAAAEAERRLRWWRGDPDAPIWVAQ